MNRAPEITVLVRHSPDCPHRQEGEDYPSCNCRKALRFTLNGKQHRQTAGTRNWKRAQEKANELIAKLVKSDEPEKVPLTNLWPPSATMG